MRQFLRIRSSPDGPKLALFVFLKREREKGKKGAGAGALGDTEKGSLRLECGEERVGWGVTEGVLRWASPGSRVRILPY